MNIMDNKPMLSVWMVAYNHEKFIRQSLEGALNQKTNFPFEIIIGEDCSTDNTRAIIKEFEATFPDIIKPIYHSSNVGAYRNAYEFCYPQLKGKYIACLEADDYWVDENKLQQQVDILENDEKAALCFTQVKVWNENSWQYEQHWSKQFNIKERYTVEDILHTFNIVTCSIVFKNRYRVLPYNPKDFPTGDVSLCAFLLLNGDAVLLNKITAVYREHDSGIYSPQSQEKKNVVFLNIFKTFLTYPAFHKQFPLIRTLLSDRAYRALCFEIKKETPDKTLVAQYHSTAVKHMHAHNLYFPLKTILRKIIFKLTGKSLGRKFHQHEFQIN